MKRQAPSDIMSVNVSADSSVVVECGRGPMADAKVETPQLKIAVLYDTKSD